MWNEQGDVRDLKGLFIKITHVGDGQRGVGVLAGFVGDAGRDGARRRPVMMVMMMMMFPRAASVRVMAHSRGTVDTNCAMNPQPRSCGVTPYIYYKSSSIMTAIQTCDTFGSQTQAWNSKFLATTTSSVSFTMCGSMNDLLIDRLIDDFESLLSQRFPCYIRSLSSGCIHMFYHLFLIKELVPRP